MKIIVVGASGTIGKEIVSALSGKHTVIPVSRSREQIRVDMSDPASIRQMFEKTGKADALVIAAGGARSAPLEKLTDDDLSFSLGNKLMGQINLARTGISYIHDGGSITLTSGILARNPAPGTISYTLVNAGVEAFVRAASLEMPRGIRINVISPDWVAETLKAMGMDPSKGVPAITVAGAYVKAVEGNMRGAVIEV